MKKCLVWLLAAALLLAGCGKKTASQAESLRQRYRDMQAAHMEAEITCHLETENRTFTVSCDWTPTGAGTTVTAPEALAGLTASVSGEDPDGFLRRGGFVRRKSAGRGSGQLPAVAAACRGGGLSGGGGPGDPGWGRLPA